MLSNYKNLSCNNTPEKNINFSSRSITCLKIGSAKATLSELSQFDRADLKALENIKNNWRTPYSEYILNAFKKQREKKDFNQRFLALEVGKGSLKDRIKGLYVLTYAPGEQTVKLDYLHSSPQKGGSLPNIGKNLLLAAMNTAKEMRAKALWFTSDPKALGFYEKVFADTGINVTKFGKQGGRVNYNIKEDQFIIASH